MTEGGLAEDLVGAAGKTLNDARLVMVGRWAYLLLTHFPEHSFSESLAARFRALFLLRNTKCDKSVEWICRAFTDSSALLKHELAYCLGQMQNPSAVDSLIGVLSDVAQGAGTIQFTSHLALQQRAFEPFRAHGPTRGWRGVGRDR